MSGADFNVVCSNFAEEGDVDVDPSEELYLKYLNHKKEMLGILNDDKL